MIRPSILALVGIICSGPLLTSCGGGGGAAGAPPPPPATFTVTSGVAQKGPLQRGSTVTAQELDASLSPTGKQYSYQVTSDLGTFSPTSTFGSVYIGLNANGYYFDEVANAVSTGTVTLTGYSNLSLDSVLNVNLLTTLTYQRIQTLVTKSSMTFSAARSQAESEVLAAFGIRNAAGLGSFSSLDVSKSSDGDHILAAISSVFVYGNTSGNLSALIASVQSDIGSNGAIVNSATQATLTASAKALNPTAIAANLTQEYSSAGIVYSASNISDWIDQDGDGLVGKFKFLVADASQNSSFTFPSSVTDPYSGDSIAVSAGQLAVNGTPVAGSMQIKKGDLVSVSPSAGAFPNGAAVIYLVSGTTRIAKVTFTANLVSIAVSPSATSVPVGASQQFAATGTFSDSSTADLTASVVWTSSVPTIAALNASTGLATALTVGDTSVSAASGSIVGSTTLSIVAPILQSIAISPNPFATGVGIARQARAIGTFSDGSTADVTATATWETSAVSVATVTGGLITGISTGNVTITATIGSVSEGLGLSVTTNTWSPASSLKNAVWGQTMTVLQSGKVLIVGGIPNATVNPTFGTQIYDPALDSWTFGPLAQVARALHTATLLRSGKVLIVGGNDQGFPTTTVEIYDPINNTLINTSPSICPHVQPTVNQLPNGKVLVAGGVVSDHATCISGFPTAELYDPASNTWTAAANMLAQRSMGETGTTLPDGRVLVAGGVGSSGIVAAAEIYDPTADAWIPAGNMTTAADQHTATLLPNGTVLIAGGSGTSGFLATTQIYDPVANAWSQKANLATARAQHTATLLTNGKVLVAGGQSTTGPFASAEIYDPAADSWSSAASMAVARTVHSAVLLTNGIVMVTGGTTTNENPTATSELYW